VDQWDRLIVRLSIPPVVMMGADVAVALGLKSLGAVEVLPGQPLFAGVAAVAPWAFFGSVALATAFVADWMYRLWRFDRCEGPMCRWCSGPLGPERQGRYELIRRCMLCSRYTGSAFYR